MTVVSATSYRRDIGALIAGAHEFGTKASAGGSWASRGVEPDQRCASFEASLRAAPQGLPRGPSAHGLDPWGRPGMTISLMSSKGYVMVRVCEEIKKGRNRAQTTPVIPAKAGTHVSVTRTFQATAMSYPTVTGTFCGAMGPGLRRGDGWISGERFFHKL